MTPLSRGSGPPNFVLRVPCLIGYSLDIRGEARLDVDGVQCDVRNEGGWLVVSAGGFSTERDAESFFPKVQRMLVGAMLADRLSIVVPTRLERPLPKSGLRFLPGDVRCRALGWPEEFIEPVQISDLQDVAWVYPDHEFVAFWEVFHAVPRWTMDGDQLRRSLEQGNSRVEGAAGRVPDILMQVAGYYAHAARTSLSPSGFQLAVTALEILADREPTSAATIDAVKKLIQCVDKLSEAQEEIDVELIKNRLNEARRKSISDAVRNILRSFPDAEGVNGEGERHGRLVRAVYAVRSAYAHGSVIDEKVSLGIDYGTLVGFTLDCLRREIERRLGE